MKDGGPAFPSRVYDEYARTVEVSQGMSLRDWFAGQAIPEAGGIWHLGSPADVAREAYLIADAMLAARGRGE